MKRTEYKAMVSHSMSSGPVYRVVYVDENGQRYIREDGKYKCIEGLPCVNYLTRRCYTKI